jgi:hypothetical protein
MKHKHKKKKKNSDPGSVTTAYVQNELEKCSHFWVLQNSAGEYFLEEKVVEQPEEIPLAYLLMKRLSHFFHCNRHVHRLPKERVPLGSTTLTSLKDFVYKSEEVYATEEGEVCLGIISASRIAKVIGVKQKDFFISEYKKIAR